MNISYPLGAYMAYHNGVWQRFYIGNSPGPWFYNGTGYAIHALDLANITPCDISDPPEPRLVVTQEPMDLAVRLVGRDGVMWAREPALGWWVSGSFSTHSCAYRFEELLNDYGPLTEWKPEADQ